DGQPGGRAARGVAVLEVERALPALGPGAGDDAVLFVGERPVQRAGRADVDGEGVGGGRVRSDGRKGGGAEPHGDDLLATIEDLGDQIEAPSRGCRGGGVGGDGQQRGGTDGSADGGGSGEEGTARQRGRAHQRRSEERRGGKEARSRR